MIRLEVFQDHLMYDVHSLFFKITKQIDSLRFTPWITFQSQSQGASEDKFERPACPPNYRRLRWANTQILAICRKYDSWLRV